MKIRRAVWHAWTRRSLTIAGPRFCDEASGEWHPMRGDNLAPLSRRDMWVLKRASSLAKHVPELSGPMYDRTYRHVLDWLRFEYTGDVNGVEGPHPHWEHSKWESDSDYSSDEDEDASDEDASDEDASPGNDDYFCYQCPYHPTRRHPSAAQCLCWENMSPAERKRWSRCADK